MHAASLSFMLLTWLLVVMLPVRVSTGNTLYVDAHNPTPPVPYNNFTDWSRAATNIQDAVSTALAGDTILVRKGCYKAAAGFTNVIDLNKPLILRAVDGRDGTLIDGAGTNRGVHIAYTPPSSTFVLDGFTISNCFADGGAGAYHYDATNRAHYLNCLFVDNVAGYGAGISSSGAHGAVIIVTNSVFLRNHSYDRYAAAIMQNSGWIEIYDSHFEDNVSNDPAVGGTRGGAMWTTGGLVENSKFINNSSTLHGNGAAGGGGIYIYNNSVTIRNCLMVGNTGYGSGALAAHANSSISLTLENCTIYSNYCNSGPNYQGGVRIGTITDARVHNSIIHGNLRLGFTDACNIMISAATPLNFTHNCTQPPTVHPGGEAAFWAAHNLTNAPLFLDPGNGDFSLHRDSPLINRGTLRDWMSGAKNLNGRSRIDKFSGVVDIGCYEYLPCGIMYKVR